MLALAVAFLFHSAVMERSNDVGEVESEGINMDLSMEFAEIEEEEEDMCYLDQGQETRCLAVVNLPWTYITADDLYLLLSSFDPKEGGKLLFVTVYPSVLGLKEEQARQGGGSANDVKDITRHYFAVAEFDSVTTADHIYKYCDGVQLGWSMHQCDLKYIRDDMEFNRPPRDLAVQAPADYDYDVLHRRLSMINNNSRTEYERIPRFHTG